jgi:hypothetical protein
MIDEAIQPFDPLNSHETIPTERSVEKVAAVKQVFIHHVETKEFTHSGFAEADFNLEGSSSNGCRSLHSIPRTVWRYIPTILPI